MLRTAVPRFLPAGATQQQLLQARPQRAAQRQRQRLPPLAATGSSTGSNGSSSSGGEERPLRRHPLLSALAGVAAAATLLAGTPLDVAEARAALTQEETRTIQLFQRSRPSVVYITSLTTRWVLGALLLGAWLAHHFGCCCYGCARASCAPLSAARSKLLRASRDPQLAAPPHVCAGGTHSP